MRRFSLVALGALATGVVGASLAWACTAPNTGIPTVAAPDSGSPPPGGAEPGAGGGAPPAGGSQSPGAGPGGGGAGSGPSGTAGSSGTADVSGTTRAVRSTGGGSAPRGAGGRVGTGTAAPTGADSPAPFGNPRSLFAARVRGATAGVTSRAGKPVFASSVAPKRAKGRARAASPSERSAGADPWSRFRAAPRSASLGSVADDSSLIGSGGGSVAGMAILALGLGGFLGTLAAVAIQRRRAEASARAGRASTGM